MSGEQCMAVSEVDQANQIAIERIRKKFPQADPARFLEGVDAAKIPQHIAIIMDGNGRWAEQRGFARVVGHRNGMGAVRDAIETCAKIGVEILTLYSFSSENWSRPSDEIQALMQMCVMYCSGEQEALAENNVRVRVLGRREGLPGDVIEALTLLEETTKDCTGLTLCLAINYGSRDEIVDAVRSIAKRAVAGEIDPAAIDAEMVSQSLYTAGLTDPELLIRTGGDFRVSNYLLWQISYSEIIVLDEYWPDFDAQAMCDAVRVFASRSRRFGGLDRKVADIQ
ncbi:MAG: isoprenyl transferase [Phycisphaerales bacterium]|nr:isoprenyl transferase [Phycisphaerales bacterium]